MLAAADTIDLGAADQSLGSPLVAGFEDVDGAGARGAVTLFGSAYNNTLRGGS